MEPVRVIRPSTSLCKYCRQTMFSVSLVVAPKGELAAGAIFRKPAKIAIVCDYCDRYSDQAQEAA